MKKLKLYILLLLVVFLSNFVSAQNLDTLQIQILAGVFEDSIILRWSPNDVKSWTFGNDNGYILERTTIKRNGTPLSTEEVRTSKQRLGSFNIASQEEWEKLMAENEYAGVAAGAIFGEGFKVEGLEDENLMSFYYLTKEQENRYGFSLFAADQSLEVSDAMGLRFVDKNFNKEEEYLYKVRFNVSQDSIYTLDGATLVNPKEKMDLAQAPEIFASFNDLFAIISWDGTDLIKDYSTYYIERSDDNGLSFNILNENPLLPNTNQKTGAKTFLYTDSLAQNGKKYMYRIRGRSLFGVIGPYSNVAEGMGEKGPLNASIRIKGITEFEEQKSIQVNWDFKEKFENGIKGFYVLRARHKVGEYERINEKIISPNERTYVDKEPLRVGYYKIEAVDTNDYVISSFAALSQLSDKIAPLPPQNLIGTIDEEGKVVLKWNANMEDDLKGYRVFMGNNENEQFAQITNKYITDTTYTHQVNMSTLSEEVYFKVIALDFRSNFSLYSQTCKLKRVDKNPPSPPAFLSIKSQEEGVYLEWASSSSPDVLAHYLLRKEESALVWDTIFSYDKYLPSTAFIDTTASDKSLSTYKVVAKDDADLISSSKMLKGKALDIGKSSAIIDWKVEKLDSDRSSLKLSWKYSEEKKKVRQFILYRATDNSPLSTYKVILRNESVLLNQSNTRTQSFEFFDQELKPRRKYKYQIIAKLSDGSYSPLSDLVEIKS